MNQQTALSRTEVGVLRSLAQQGAERMKQERGDRKLEIEREMEATWAAEREIDQRLEPRITELEEQLLALNAQRAAVYERIQALRVEMQQAKAPHADRRRDVRREQWAILEAELLEEQAEKIR